MLELSKARFTVLLFLTVTGLWFIRVPRWVGPLPTSDQIRPQFRDKLGNETSLNQIDNKEITVLFWNRITGEVHPEHTLLLRDERRCRFTNSPSELVNSTIVVINFHQLSWHYMSPANYIPPKHPTGQRWVFLTQEPPTFLWESDIELLRKFGTHFNATATYLVDSDIDVSYGHYQKRMERPSQDEMTRNYAANRTRQVLWIVNHCDLSRMYYAHELNKHIRVDIYGRCGKPLPEQCSIPGAPCISLLSPQYKFYLAFENSDCDDYITEKLWRNSFSNDLVPIVRGRRQRYDKHAPPGSYVSADNFASPRELATYLRLLDQNDAMYNELFQWRLQYTFLWNPMMSQTGQQFDLFDEELCEYAHRPTQVKWYDVAATFNTGLMCQ